MSGTKVMVKKNISLQNKKIAAIALGLPLAAFQLAMTWR